VSENLETKKSERKSSSLRKITSINQIDRSGLSGYYDKTKSNRDEFDSKKFSRNRTAKEFQTPKNPRIVGLGMALLRQIGLAKHEELDEPSSEDNMSKLPGDRPTGTSPKSGTESFGDSSHTSEESKQNENINASRNYHRASLFKKGPSLDHLSLPIKGNKIASSFAKSDYAKLVVVNKDQKTGLLGSHA
jgi:hypothetical protein